MKGWPKRKLVALMIGLCLLLVQTALADTSKEAALPTWLKYAERNEASAIENAPRVKTLDNGVQVQVIPDDGAGKNNAYLNADNRGCQACHDLEDTVTTIPTQHGVTYNKYATEKTVGTCLACHSWNTISTREVMHGLHMKSAAFNAINGSCESCHFIESGNMYRLWDEVRYDHVWGITDIAASDVQAEITYDQTTVTPRENMYFKTSDTHFIEPVDWLTDDSQITPDIYEQWEITVQGDMDNPFTMKLSEMVEKFGTVTQVMTNHCTVNGLGDGLVYAAEATGISIKSILEYAQVHDDVTTVKAICSDFCNSGVEGADYVPVGYDFAIENDALLVVELNGEPIPAAQGYPCSFWVYNASGGNFSKGVTTLEVIKEEESSAWVSTGDTVNPTTGEFFAKPNIGVLTEKNGTIFSAGDTVHLEGYADGWDEPIVSLEYSFDHGNSWITVETPDNSSRYWTYWRMDFTPPAEGAYLLRMRTTSMMPDGELRVSPGTVDFLINVK